MRGTWKFQRPHTHVFLLGLDYLRQVGTAADGALSIIGHFPFLFSPGPPRPLRRGDLGNMNSGSAKAEKMSKGAVSIVGKVGDDGRTFVGDKNGKTWKVSNADALKGHEGHHVKVRAHVDADKDEIHITSVRMLKSAMKAEAK